MKTIIAGSRSIKDIWLLDYAYKQFQRRGYEITEVVSGTAKGVDQLGIKLGDAIDVPIKRFPADWKRYGKKAGYLRNEEMAKYADAAIILWDGESRGTKHMINLAKKHNLKTLIIKLP